MAPQKFSKYVLVMRSRYSLESASCDTTLPFMRGIRT